MRTPHASARTGTTPAMFVRRIMALLAVGGLVLLGSDAVHRVRAGGVWYAVGQSTPRGFVTPIGYRELAQRDTTIAVWEQALAADTGSALVLGQLAALHLQRAREGGGYSDYEAAESLARHSLARRTNRNGATAVTLVNALLAQHRFTDARSVATVLVQREFDIPEYRALLGEVAMELGDDVVSSAMFRSVWEQRTDLSLAPRVARWLEITNHVSDARALLTQARDAAAARRSTASETKAWFNLRLGDLELRAGNVRRAEQAYRQGLAEEPGDPRLFSAMARLAMANNEPRDAATWGERAIGLQLDPATLGLLADAYTALGDTAKANDYLNTLDISVTTQPGAYHRAWALSLLDHHRQIDTVLAKASAELRDRRDVYGYDVVAWALFTQGRAAEAADMMRYALRLHTPDPLLARHAAAIGLASHQQLAER